MAGLLYKELVLNKKILLIIGGGILFFSIFLFIPLSQEDFKDGGELVYKFLMGVVAVMIFVMAGVAQDSIFTYDERKKWSEYICSTPLSVKGQVLSKYYFSLLISIATLVYCNLVFNISAVIQGRDCGAMSFAYMAFIVQLFMRSVEFPFLIRFGSKNGNYYRMALFGVIFFAVFVYCLFGDMSIFGTFEDFMDWFTSLIEGKSITDAMLICVALAPFIAGEMYYLSYKISCRLYMEGAENYDK